MPKAELQRVRRFGIALAIFVISIAIVRWARGIEDFLAALLALAGILCCLSLFVPRALIPVYRCSLALGRLVLWINTRIFLVLVFFLLVTPLGFVFRLLRKDPLDRRFANGSKSFWKQRPRALPANIRLKRQF